MKITKCIVCGGERIIPDMKIEDSSDTWEKSIKVHMLSKPDALIFKNKQTGILKGSLCCDCGYVHLFCSADLDLFWKLYKKAKKPGYGSYV